MTLLVAAAATVAAGLAVHFGAEGPVGDFAGDALYAVLIYFVVALVAPRARATTVGVIAFGFCAAVELFQLTGIPAAITAQFPPAALVLGSSFAALDLVAYAVGVALAAALDRSFAALSHRRPGA